MKRGKSGSSQAGGTGLALSDATKNFKISDALNFFKTGRDQERSRLLGDALNFFKTNQIEFQKPKKLPESETL